MENASRRCSVDTQPINARSGSNSYVSNLNWEDASRYSRRQTNRLISTPKVAMISVDPSSTSNLPESLAPPMGLPRPPVETNLPSKLKYPAQRPALHPPP